MEARRTMTLPDPERATASEIEEALVHFDELDASSLERLEDHPAHGPTLSLLREAEAWLAEAGPEAFALGPCPPAEALYDLGRGPGFHPLPPGEEASLAEHVERCADCTALLTSLKCAPPLPLAVSEPPLSVVRPRRQPHRLVLIAAAASLLLATFVLPGLLEDPLSGLPETPLYRGQASESLFFPRGPLLDRGELPSTLDFELAEVAGAEEYRIEIFRHAGGAFDSGELVSTHTPGTNHLERETLPIGHYTWRAWARVKGLEQDLGARDFEVRANPELLARLGRLEDDASVAEVVEEIRLLDQAGFLTDARALARSLPESEERDAYLRPPGR